MDPAEERRRRAATAPAPNASTQNRKTRHTERPARRKPENVRDTFADEETITSKRDFHFKKNRASNMLQEITTSPERKGMHHIYERGIVRLFMKGTR